MNTAFSPSFFPDQPFPSPKGQSTGDQLRGTSVAPGEPPGHPSRRSASDRAATPSESAAGPALSGPEASRAHPSSRKDQTLSRAEQAQLEALKTRDREVRAHEQAHVAAGGRHVRGGARLTTQVGPDGRRYAVGGEVSIDVSEVEGDPRATLHKARAIQRAALAPVNPSAQDRAVAARAAAMAQEARQELARERAQPSPDGEESRLQGSPNPAAGGSGSEPHPPSTIHRALRSYTMAASDHPVPGHKADDQTGKLFAASI